MNGVVTPDVALHKQHLPIANHNELAVALIISSNCHGGL
jgi:hypothetical protein